MKNIMSYFNGNASGGFRLDKPPPEDERIEDKYEKHYNYTRKEIYDAMEILCDKIGFQELTVTFNMRRYSLSEDAFLRDRLMRTLYKCGVHTYLLIPCIADNNMLHYHGVVKASRTSLLKFRRMCLFKDDHTQKDPWLGYINVKYIRDGPSYYNYIKDAHQRSNEYDDDEFCSLTLGMRIMDVVEFVKI